MYPFSISSIIACWLPSSILTSYLFLFIKFFTSSKFAFLPVSLYVLVCIEAISSVNSSFALASLYFSPATSAFFNIPFSPSVKCKVNPARISNRIIVIIRAIKVMPVQCDLAVAVNNE